MMGTNYLVCSYNYFLTTALKSSYNYILTTWNRKYVITTFLNYQQSS